MKLGQDDYLQLKEATSWGYDTVTRDVYYSARASASSAVRSLRKKGWYVSSAYPAIIHDRLWWVVATRKANRRGDYNLPMR